MRILWLTWKDRENPLAGGAEVVAHELGRRLVADGHELTFVTSGFPDATPTLTTDGYNVIRVGSRFTVYWHAWRWYRKNGRGKFDLVIDECNTMPFFAKFYTDTNTIMLIHMLCREIWFYEFPKYLAWVGYLIEPIYLRMISNQKAITISKSTKHDLIKYGFDESNISIISMGSDLTPAEDILTFEKYNNPTILSFGSIRPMKRTMHQLEAFIEAKKIITNLRFILAGDNNSDYGRKVLETAQNSGLIESIDILGRTSINKKLEIMRKSHLIVVTSVKEGWGLIVTEAASQGTPAVVYDVDGLRDSVIDNNTGLISNKNTPLLLADKIVELIQNREQYNELRSSGWQLSHNITFENSYIDFTRALNI